MALDFKTQGILDEVLLAFTGTIDSGFGLIEGDVTFLWGTLLVMALSFTGFRVMLGGPDEIITAGRRAMLWMVILYLINTWQTNTRLIQETAIELGLRASGGFSSFGQKYLSPSKIVEMGFHQFNALMETASSGGINLLVVNISIPTTDYIIYVVAGLIILVAFTIIALQLLITIIEFKLLTLAAFILIPFGILTRTSFLMERALGYVASTALKFMTLAFIVAISMAIVEDFNSNHVTVDFIADTRQAALMAITAIVIAGLAISIPATAAGLISGGPSLGIGALAGGAAVGAAATAGVAGAGAAAATGGAAAVRGAPGMLAQMQAALSSGGGTLKNAGSLVGKATGVSAGASASQGPRGSIGDTSSGSEGDK